MLWCYFPSLGTLVQEMRYANYPSSVASPLSHSPMVVFLPGRQYKLFQDGSANGPRKCISLAPRPAAISVMTMTLASSRGYWSRWWHVMTSPSLIPWLRVIPSRPAPVLKAKDGDMLGFVVKLAYIGLHHHCILKPAPIHGSDFIKSCQTFLKDMDEWIISENWWMCVKRTKSLDF